MTLSVVQLAMTLRRAGLEEDAAPTGKWMAISPQLLRAPMRQRRPWHIGAIPIGANLGVLMTRGCCQSTTGLARTVIRQIQRPYQ